jgi:phosphoribosyl-AMP cyclohydrolase
MSERKLDFAKQGGLLPVIVTDYQTGQVLMLAYMNEEAYRLTLETKQMHYWSRSRNELWWLLSSKKVQLVTQEHTAASSMRFYRKEK